MTLLGRAWNELTLIRLAYGYEQVTHHRKAPPTTPPIR
jgi:Asp-tRNA(Asn)/Glu-tRNA(Gln) amidotransferase A subunit family amidase